MAVPVRTTLASAVSVDDKSIVVASANSFASGKVIDVDGEQMEVIKGYVSGTTIPVLRGRGGTKTFAHPRGAGVVFALAEEYPQPGAGGFPVNWPNMRTRYITSYTADGAIALPVPGTDAIAMLNGTVQWDMTVAAPTLDLDGCILYVIGNGKSAHTVTIAGGLGAARSGYTVATFLTGSQMCLVLMAANGAWVPCPGPFSGTLTAVLIAVA